MPSKRDRGGPLPCGALDEPPHPPRKRPRRSRVSVGPMRDRERRLTGAADAVARPGPVSWLRAPRPAAQPAGYPAELAAGGPSFGAMNTWILPLVCSGDALPVTTTASSGARAHDRVGRRRPTTAEPAGPGRGGKRREQDRRSARHEVGGEHEGKLQCEHRKEPRLGDDAEEHPVVEHALEVLLKREGKRRQDGEAR